LSRAEDGKCLLEWLREHKLDEYGSVIRAASVQEVLGIVVPERADKRTFDQLALKELSAVDYVRNILLGEGKYLAQHQGDYRILLPSENARQVELYLSSADGKLRRAMKLLRNTPSTDDSINRPPENVAARILMKRESIKAQRRKE
jgi:hypothetical protein